MEGIILAAGLSSRLPSYKLTQKINGKCLIEHTVINMRSYVNRIVVVTGHNKEMIEEVLRPYKNVVCVYNENYKQGMYESIKVGVNHISEDFFLMPGDIVHVRPHVFEALAHAKGQVVIPSFEYQAGHPIKLAANLGPLIKHSAHEHLRAFLKDFEKVYITVSDPGILMDVDTLEDLEMIRGVMYENH